MYQYNTWLSMSLARSFLLRCLLVGLRYQLHPKSCHKQKKKRLQSEELPVILTNRSDGAKRDGEVGKKRLPATLPPLSHHCPRRRAHRTPSTVPAAAVPFSAPAAHFPPPLPPARHTYRMRGLEASVAIQRWCVGVENR